MKKNKLYYMTQYASYMTDQGYYQAMDEQVQKLDDELLTELMEIAPEVDDKYNQILFDLLFTINNEDLEKLVALWDHLKDNNIIDFLDGLNIGYNDLLNVDDYIYTYDDLEYLADEDFKNNGINANALYWYEELEKNSGYDYFVFNGYGNGFYCYDDINDALDDFIDFNDIKNIILEYFKK